MNPSQPKNQKPTITTSVPGPNSKALRAREDAHLAPGLQGYALRAHDQAAPTGSPRGARLLTGKGQKPSRRGGSVVSTGRTLGGS